MNALSDEIISEVAELKRMLELREQQLGECTVAMREAATTLRDGAKFRMDDAEVMHQVADDLMKVRYEAGMTSWFTDVLAFMKKLKQPIGEKTLALSKTSPLVRLRVDLIREEFDELQEAVVDEDLVEIADALADLVYVTIGMAITYGIDLRPVWNEVHRTNMMKEGGGLRADGKILKPAGWQQPNIAAALEAGKVL